MANPTGSVPKSQQTSQTALYQSASLRDDYLFNHLSELVIRPPHWQDINACSLFFLLDYHLIADYMVKIPSSDKR